MQPAGKNLYENEMYDEAVMWLNAACDMDTTYDNPYYYLGKSYQAMGKYEEAIERYGRRKD